MDIEKLLTAGEWLNIQEVEGYSEFGSFNLKISPIDPLAYLDIVAEMRSTPNDIPEEIIRKKFFELFPKIFDLVVDWDFKSGEDKVECTQENKQRYLQRLLTRRVKRESEFGERLLMAILNFAFGAEDRPKN